MARQEPKNYHSRSIGPMDKSEFRYQFDRSLPKKKFRCPNPSCGKMTFTRYVDVSTGEYLPEQYGICDREDKCGYHCIPTGKDLGENELFVPSTKVKDIYKVDENRIPNCISHSIVLESLKNYHKNNFAYFLFKHFDKDTVWRILTRYKIGTTDEPWAKSVIFWQLDRDFNARTGKIMDYDPVTCKRVKQVVSEDKVWPHINWMHTKEGTDYVLRQVLFGEHLINDKVNTYYLFEAEKTAIICSIKNPSQICLATGGLQNLREDTMKVLIGKKIIAVPDKGSAYGKWKKKIEDNLPNYDITLSNKLEKNNLIEDGDDMADLILKEMGL